MSAVSILLVAAALSPPAADPSAAEGWARGFWTVCALYLLFRAWRGWQAGLARQVVAVGALVLAYLAGVYGAPELAPGLRDYLHAPDVVLEAVAGTGIGLVVYYVANAAARVFFPRTRDRAPGPGRLLWGGGGALVSVGVGLVSLWVVCIGVRLAGSLAEGHLEATKPPARVSPMARQPGEKPPPATPPKDSSLEETLQGLAVVKGTLDRGVVGEVMATVDPVPPAAYTTLNKLARVVSDPPAMDRFRNNFMVRQLGVDPKIAALLDDPGVSRDLAAKNYRALLFNPRLLAVANDPQLARRLRAFDLSRALDEALREKG